MGCGSSAVAPDGESSQNVNQSDLPLKTQSKKETETTNHSNHSKSNGQSNGHTDSGLPPLQDKNRNNHKEPLRNKQNLSTVDKNANKLNALDQAPVPKSIAFDVAFEEGNPLQPKRKPARLLTLEPLNVSTLTAAQLEEKQRIADEKRERLRQKKVNKSQKSSKRRKELLKAREFGMRQQVEQEKSAIEDSIRQAEIKRDQRLMEVKEKQKIREERARRARERAKQIQNPEDEVEVEKDEQFNATSDESWLDNASHPNKTAEERADEEDIQKRMSRQSNSLRHTASASTVDSYDAAFMRTKNHENIVLGNDDDFFGS